MLPFQILHTFRGLRRYTRGSASSCPFRVSINDAAGFTSCYGLQFCFTRFGLFTGLHSWVLTTRCLLATRRSGPYLDRTFTGKLCLALLGARAGFDGYCPCSDTVRLGLNERKTRLVLRRLNIDQT